MSFISGIQLIDAPASALNNAGADTSSSNENSVAVKKIVSGGKSYPYVSAQAYRFWLRRTLEANGNEWAVAPIFREKKVAYTDANPIDYCDDDLFGYMRAPSKKTDSGASEQALESLTKTDETVTRVSPLKIGTLVALSDGVTRDFGTMSRHDGDPVPHEHQFYRTSLKGMFSLDLRNVGRFSYERKTGFLNLDKTREELSKQKGLTHEPQSKTYSLAQEERLRRIKFLLDAMPVVTGGAKQGLHYTDVSPVVVVMVVMKGGNNPFQYVIQGNKEGKAVIKTDVLTEIIEVWGEYIQSPIYIGWVKGYADEERAKLEGALSTLSAASPHGIQLAHPKVAFANLSAKLMANPEWLD